MKMIPQDKANHVVAGTAVALAGVLIGKLCAPGYELVFGIAFVAVPALAREGYNKVRGGVWDWADIVATLAGGALVAFAVL